MSARQAPMVALGIVLSIVATAVLTTFGSQFVRSGAPAVAFAANIVVLAIGGIVCLIRSPRRRSLGMGLMIGWAVQVLVAGACVALVRQQL